MADMNMGDCLRLSARKSPNKAAFKFGQREMTYRDLDLRSNKVANVLSGMGLKKGNKCSVMLYNSLESIETLFGMAKAGIICVPVNFRFTSREVEYVVNHSDSEAILLGEEFVPTLSSLWESFRFGKGRCIVVGRETGGAANYEALMAHASDADPQVGLDGKDIYFMGYTSGTTSFPKGVPIAHDRFLIHAAQTMIDYSRMIEDDRMLMIMPLCHSNSIWFASFVVITGAFAHIYPSGGFDPEEILKIIDEDKISCASVVPTMLNLITNLPEGVKNRYDNRSLKNLWVGSAPILAKTKEETLRFFSSADLYEGYGATETGCVTSLKPKYQWEKLRSAGKPVIYKEVKLLDGEGREVPTGEPGEIYCRGLGILLQEYYKQPDATAAAFRGEWCSVGDIARRDEDGFIYIVDRKQDMIISGGENISPTEVEDQIIKHPAVLEVAVVGQPDEKWGDAVTAVVVVKQGMTVTAEELIEFCRDKLAGFKRPKHVDFAKELPKTASGKILRKIVREPYWEDRDKMV